MPGASAKIEVADRGSRAEESESNFKPEPDWMTSVTSHPNAKTCAMNTIIAAPGM
jgi:hypothetical protein